MPRARSISNTASRTVGIARQLMAPARHRRAGATLPGLGQRPLEGNWDFMIGVLGRHRLLVIVIALMAAAGGAFALVLAGRGETGRSAGACPAGQRVVRAEDEGDR